MLNNASVSKILDEVERRAREYEAKYFGCSQCILRAIQEIFKLKNGEVLKAASALAGGVARRGETCGAVTGGILALGLVFGRKRMEEKKYELDYEKTMQVANRFCEKFEGEFEATLCRQVQQKIFGRHFDLNDPKQREEFDKIGGHNEWACPTVVGKAARMVAEILLEEDPSWFEKLQKV